MAVGSFLRRLRALLSRRVWTLNGNERFFVTYAVDEGSSEQMVDILAAKQGYW